MVRKVRQCNISWFFLILMETCRIMVMKSLQFGKKGLHLLSTNFDFILCVAKTRTGLTKRSRFAAGYLNVFKKSSTEALNKVPS